MNDFSEINKLITDSNKIIITTHIKPDGDAIGSEIGFALFLKKLGKDVKIINEDQTPNNLTFIERLFPVEIYNEQLHNEVFRYSDLIIVLDLSSSERIPNVSLQFKNTKAKIICIDHHTYPEKFFNFAILNERAAATAELIFELISKIDYSKIDSEIATALYTGILTDTGSFRFNSTTEKIHKIISELLILGASPSNIYNEVFEQESLNKIHLTALALKSMQLYLNGKVSIFEITRKDFLSTNTDQRDVENIINYGLTIKGTKTTILLTEFDGFIKVGFRSKDSIPVNLLAKEFGGGGHLSASSAKILNANLVDIKKLILEKLNKYIKD